MKKLNTVFIALSLAAASCITSASAQVKEEVKHDTKKVGKEVKKDANKAGNKTAEVASKAEAKVVDHEYKDKVGPNGETIYIDRHSKYYWVDKKGHHRYIKEAALKNKQ
jgi:hypothetical protein